MNSENYEHYQMQDALQRSQLDQNTSMYAPQLAEQVQQQQAVMVDQTNPKKVVREIILRLRGLEEDGSGNFKQVAEPKMNQVGVDNIWYILDSHINDNIRFSHLEEHEIANIMDSLQDDLVDDLALNWRIYGIKRKTDLDTINNSILVNVFAILNRAKGQNEKNWIGKISVENISSNSRLPTQKKEGWLNKLRLG